MNILIDRLNSYQCISVKICRAFTVVMDSYVVILYRIIELYKDVCVFLLFYDTQWLLVGACIHW